MFARDVSEEQWGRMCAMYLKSCGGELRVTNLKSREGCDGEACVTYLRTRRQTRDVREIIIRLWASGILCAFAGDSRNFRETWDVCHVKKKYSI